MQTAPLTISNVSKAYGTHQVLSDVSLGLVQGEIFGLIGLNGVGKTTLIKSILDLIQLQQGNIEIFGQSSTHIRSRSYVSYLPEKFQPSRYLKGYEYLTLALSYYGKKLDKVKAQAVAAELDLDPAVLPARVGSYSKGMGQKLGLLGAFLIETPLLILDQPMSGLDPRARIKLKHVLKQARREGRTVFFSSHILSDIDEICDRIGIIHDGRLIFTGTPSLFKQCYKDTTLETSFLRAIENPDLCRAA